MEEVPGSERQIDVSVHVGGSGGAAAPLCVQEVMHGLLTQEFQVFQQEESIKI